jgi:hypothetical protein
MRALCLAMLVALFPWGGCSNAHIDLRFDVALGTQCPMAALGNPSAPMTCGELTLGCATHLQFRVREVAEMDRPGNILSARCLDLAQAGRPRDLCQLEKLDNPLSLIDAVPHGTRFIFQLAALRVTDPDGNCDGETPALRVFSGVSDPVLIDGEDHAVTVHLQSCGSCDNLPGFDGGGQAVDLGLFLTDLAMAPQDMNAAADAAISVDLAGADFSHPDMAEPLCPAGQSPSEYFDQGGAQCCETPRPPGCLMPGADCGSGGVRALLPPGGCCAVCD